MLSPFDMKLQSAGGIRALKDNPFTSFWGELKYDGMRAKVIKHDGSLDLHSRTGKSQLGKCPHIESALSKLPDGTVLDGEFILIPENPICIDYQYDGSEGSLQLPDFNKTMRVMGSLPAKALVKQEEHGKITLALFDILAFNGQSLIDLPLSKRRVILEEVIKHFSSDYIMVAPKVDPDEELLARLIEYGAEGVMIKNDEAVYELGKRSGNWRKLKFVMDSDVVITGFTNGQGKYADTIGAIKFGQYKDCNQCVHFTDPASCPHCLGKGVVLTSRGQTSGMTDQIRRMVGSDPGKYTGKVITVKHMGTYPDSKGFRHPQWKTWRDDKLPEECTWDD